MLCSKVCCALKGIVRPKIPVPVQMMIDSKLPNDDEGERPFSNKMEHPSGIILEYSL